MIRLGILGSTSGTSLQAIIDAITAKQLAAKIVTVLSNKSTAGILERAQRYHLPNAFVNPVGLTREAYDQQLAQLFLAQQVDLIVLIGYMRILTPEFVQRFQHKMINIHPSLLPAFSGLMDLQVHEAVLKAGIKQTGCTVHYVTEQVDAGPILLQQTCEVQENESPQSLKQRVQSLEGPTLVAAIQLFAKQR